MKNLTIKVSSSNLTSCKDILLLDEQLSGLISPKVEIDFTNVESISSIAVGCIINASTKRIIKINNVLPMVKEIFKTLNTGNKIILN